MIVSIAILGLVVVLLVWLVSDDDPEMKARFEPVAAALADNEKKINSELLLAQGRPVDIGGYYHPDEAKCRAAMRPSTTFNGIIDEMSAAPSSA